MITSRFLVSVFGPTPQADFLGLMGIALRLRVSYFWELHSICTQLYNIFNFVQIKYFMNFVHFQIGRYELIALIFCIGLLSIVTLTYDSNIQWRFCFTLPLKIKRRTWYPATTCWQTWTTWERGLNSWPSWAASPCRRITGRQDLRFPLDQINLDEHKCSTMLCQFVCRINFKFFSLIILLHQTHLKMVTSDWRWVVLCKNSRMKTARTIDV